jgi:hypothetical protein
MDDPARNAPNVASVSSPSAGSGPEVHILIDVDGKVQVTPGAEDLLAGSGLPPPSQELAPSPFGPAPHWCQSRPLTPRPPDGYKPAHLLLNDACRAPAGEPARPVPATSPPPGGPGPENGPAGGVHTGGAEGGPAAGAFVGPPRPGGGAGPGNRSPFGDPAAPGGDSDRLVALCLRVPGLAAEARAWERKLGGHALFDEAGGLLVLAADCLAQKRPADLAGPAWWDTLWRVVREELLTNRPGDDQDLAPRAAEYRQLALDVDALPAPRAEGRHLLKEIVQEELARRLANTLKLQRLSGMGPQYEYELASTAQLLTELKTWGAEAEGFTATAEALSEFLARPKEQVYLVEGVLAAGQIAIIGGPEKGQKSNIAMDLALSLASGTKFLGRFEVSKPRRTLVLTGETTEAPLENLLRRILLAKGLGKGDALPETMTIKQDLPNLNSPADLATLVQLIARYRAEVVVLDPTYFMFGADAQGRPVDMGSLVQVGRLMLTAGRLCIEAGCTPVFLHHMSKSSHLQRSQQWEPMELADLTGAGFGPVARQWTLISYLEPYDPATGRCKIWLKIGGSAGHGGLHVASIDEAVFQKGAELNGRRWAVAVKSGTEAVAAANQARQAEKAKKQADQSFEDKEKLMAVLNGLHGGETQSALQELSGVPKRRVGQALLALFQALRVAKTRVVKAAGNDQARHYDGWRSLEGVGRTAAHEQRLRNGEFFEVVFAPAAAGGDGPPPAAS